MREQQRSGDLDTHAVESTQRLRPVWSRLVPVDGAQNPEVMAHGRRMRRPVFLDRSLVIVKEALGTTSACLRLLPVSREPWHSVAAPSEIAGPRAPDETTEPTHSSRGTRAKRAGHAESALPQFLDFDT